MIPLRAAVVGVGMIGSLHARTYREHPRAELVGVFDRDEARARLVAAECETRWYPNVDALLARERPDMVSIATPEHERHAPAVACARAGAHLLLEKPLAPTLASADALIAALRPFDVTIMVNFLLRSDPRYLRAKAAIRDGVVGEPCTLFARRRGTALGAEIYGPWTDLLMSTAIHDLDAMAWLTDSRVQRVHAEGVVKRCAEWGHEDAVAAVLRFTNGAIGLLETSWVLPSSAPAPVDASLQVVGTGGAIFIEGSNHGMAILDRDSYRLPDLAHWPVGRSGVEGDLRASIDHFIDCVVTGSDPVMGLDGARDAQEIVAACKASLRTGMPVELPYQEPSGSAGPAQDPSEADHP